MNDLILYTDGSCFPNPGVGGWAYILLNNNNIVEINSGSVDKATNNQMELISVIKGLQSIKTKVTVCSDSAYVVNCFLQKWYLKWRSNGWINSKKKPVENRDLWEELLNLVEKYEVNFLKTKGHANDHLNNRCDKLANEARLAHTNLEK